MLNADITQTEKIIRSGCMSPFTLSGFADEIALDLDGQITSLLKLGIGFIEIRMVDGKNIIEYDLGEIKSFKAKLDAAGIGVSAFGSPIGKVPVDAPFDEYLKVFGHALDIADALGTQMIRLFSFYLPKGANPKDHRDEVIRRMTVFVREAERRGITLIHENEAGIYGETAECCADLFGAIPSANFKAVFDPANFVVAREATYPYAYDLLKDHIAYVHVKDAVADGDAYEIRPAGEGVGHVPEILAALKRDGYAGFLSIEPHLHSMYAKMDIFAAYRKALDDGEPTDIFVADGFNQFKRAHDAVVKILGAL